MKLGQSKEDKLRRVTLQIDSSDITFAFKVRIMVLNPILLGIQAIVLFPGLFISSIHIAGKSFLSKMPGAAKMLTRLTVDQCM
jgi:hypothetical protein